MFNKLIKTTGVPKYLSCIVDEDKCANCRLRFRCYTEGMFIFDGWDNNIKVKDFLYLLKKVQNGKD